jgi:putative transposase
MIPRYSIRVIRLGRTDQLDALARECGRVYNATLDSYWRVARKKHIRLKPSSLTRWQKSELLHDQTVFATVKDFCNALKSWRTRCCKDPKAQPPRRQKEFFRIEYKAAALHLKKGQLRLSNGKGNTPLILPWRWACPKIVVIQWRGDGYEAIASYALPKIEALTAGRVVAVDLGAIHPVVTSEGLIANGRYLRSLRRLRSKNLATIQAKLDRKQPGSRRHKRLKEAKQQFLERIDHRIQDVLHKTTRRLVSTWKLTNVQTVVIGDVWGKRKNNDHGGTRNPPRLPKWDFGAIRWFLTYKAQREGMSVAVQDEAHSSQICPVCGVRRKTKKRMFRCLSCGLVAHRDVVGATNILRFYQGGKTLFVAGCVAQPRGVRFHAHLACSERLLAVSEKPPP